MRPDGLPEVEPATEMGMTADRCLTLDEVAGVLGVSARTVRRLIKDGKLCKVPLPRSVRITRSELVRFLEFQPEATSRAPLEELITDSEGYGGPYENIPQ